MRKKSVCVFLAIPECNVSSSLKKREMLIVNEICLLQISLFYFMSSVVWFVWSLWAVDLTQFVSEHTHFHPEISVRLTPAPAYRSVAVVCVRLCLLYVVFLHFLRLQVLFLVRIVKV